MNNHDNNFIKFSSLEINKFNVFPIIAENNSYRNKLVHPDEIPAHQLKYYQKYNNIDKKEEFRKKLSHIIGKDFINFVNYLRQDGVILFREFIQKSAFSALVNAYNKKLNQSNRSKIGHYFFDFREQIDFLTCPIFKEAFLHPFLIALIAYELGGPVRLVDVRGKDTEPTLCTDRDNGLHIDDSPYAREYKFLLVWEKGKTSGPQGQNFVAIPGTHHFVRVINSEHGANFRTPTEIINEILLHPKLKDHCFVMEAKDKDPLTIVFEATALAHQRFRTNEKFISRSCLIFAFHIDDEINKPIPYLPHLPNSCNNFERFIMEGSWGECSVEEKNRYFLFLINQQRSIITEKIAEINKKNKFIPAIEKCLSKEKTIKWLTTIAKTPQISEKKPRLKIKEINKNEFVQLLLLINEYDKHADLDLELYLDRRELPRKALRTKIRERVCTQPNSKNNAISRFLNLKSMHFNDILDIITLKKFSFWLCKVLDKIIREPLTSNQLHECIALRQLTFDIGNAFFRNKNIQDFRSHSIFLYWTFDEVFSFISKLSFHSNILSEIDKKAQILLQHYATLVVTDDYHYIIHQEKYTNIYEKFILDIQEFSIKKKSPYHSQQYEK